MGIETAIGAALITGAGQVISSNQQNKAAQKIANQQQAFELEMSNTQYQRGVEDLKSAGLNPILAVGKPAGMPSYDPPSFQSPIGSAMQAGIQNFSAVQSARQSDANIDNIKSQSRLNDALVAKAAADTTSALATAANTTENTAKTKAGSWSANLIGTEAASKTSQFLNNSIDNASQKIEDIIRGVRANSAKALDTHMSKDKAVDEYKRMYKTPHRHGELYSLPPAPPLPSYWKDR